MQTSGEAAVRRTLTDLADQNSTTEMLLSEPFLVHFPIARPENQRSVVGGAGTESIKAFVFYAAGFAIFVEMPFFILLGITSPNAYFVAVFFRSSRRAH